MANNDAFKKEMLDDIAGKKDDPNNISLADIKKGELGSSEKPARSLNEFMNIAKDKLTDESITKKVNNSPLPVTSITPQGVRAWLLMGINLLDPVKHKVYKKILEARVRGVDIQTIAWIMKERPKVVKNLENNAIREVQNLISKHQKMLNAGLIINAN